MTGCRFSIQCKLVGLWVVTSFVLLTVMAVMQYENLQISDRENAAAVRKRNLLIQESLLKQQKQTLEKALTLILNFDEVAKFISEPDNSQAMMVVSGMLLSLQKENICRFTLYGKNHEVLAQHVSKEVPLRQGRLPDRITTEHDRAAADLSNVTYFRGAEGSGHAIPSELCSATVVTDRKDRPIGFVEIALPARVWLDELAEQSQSFGLLMDGDSQQFVYWTDPAIHEQLARRVTSADVADGMAVHSLGESYLQVDRLPIHGPGDIIESWIWLAQDSTARILEQRKNMFYGGMAFLALSVLSVLAAVLLIRRGVIAPVHRTISELNNSVGHVNRAAERVNDASHALADGANVQSSSLQESSASLEQITAVTRQSSGNAETANQLMREAAQRVQSGTEVFWQLKETMDEIVSANTMTVKILKSIDNIAFQTNLLALNASVEAARAGEAGAGFSVVADEVRNLASRVAEASRETSRLLDTTMKKVHEGQDRVKTSREVLESIAEKTVEAAGIIETIAHASVEQTQGIEHLNRAISEIERVVQSNAADAHDSADLAQSMTAQAANICSQMDILSMVVNGKARAKELGMSLNEDDGGAVVTAIDRSHLSLRPSKRAD